MTRLLQDWVSPQHQHESTPQSTDKDVSWSLHASVTHPYHQLTQVFTEGIQSIAGLLLHLRGGVMHDMEHPRQQLLVVLIDVRLAVLRELPQGKGSLPPHNGLRVLQPPNYNLQSGRADITLQSIPLHYVTLPYITLRCVALRCVALRYVALRCVALRYVTLRYITLHYITLHYITLHYIADVCITFTCCRRQTGCRANSSIHEDTQLR